MLLEFMYNLPKEIRSRTIKNINGLSMHILEAGYQDPSRPCIILLHGFPELSYSWRKILIPLANAGYYVVAPDQRGYGMTSGWSNNYDGDISQFFILNIVEDLKSLIKALNLNSIECLVGHDFGSFVAAYSALLFPNIFKSVVLMSAPFSGAPKVSQNLPKNKIDNIHDDLRNLNPPRKHYQWYFSSKEANDNMINSDQGVHDFLRAYYHFKSADWELNKPFKLKSWSATELEKLPRYYIMNNDKGMAETVVEYMPSRDKIDNCNWLTENELLNYSKIYKKTGFQGGLNWYRCMISQKFLKKLSKYSGLKITIPSCFIAGESDWGIFQKPGSYQEMYESVCSQMKEPVLIQGAGHWVQQEKPNLTFKKIIEFIRGLNNSIS